MSTPWLYHITDDWQINPLGDLQPDRKIYATLFILHDQKLTTIANLIFY